MTDLDRDRVSRATGDDASSTGASTNASGGAGSLARNHKARKIENVQLKQQVMQQEAEMEKIRAAYEKMRMDLEKARIGNGDVMMMGNEEEATRAGTEGKDEKDRMETEKDDAEGKQAEEDMDTGNDKEKGENGTHKKAGEDKNVPEEQGNERTKGADNGGSNEAYAANVQDQPETEASEKKTQFDENLTDKTRSDTDEKDLAQGTGDK